MTAKRAAAYSGGVLLLLAWLASAAGLGRQRVTPAQAPEPVETSGSTLIAADVQAQTERLKSRMATAPAPQIPVRNPFMFASKDVAPRRAAKSAEIEPPPLPAVLEPAEPAIDLVGIAEDKTPKGIVRTAIISALSGELFLVKEGESIVGRYRVTAVGADSVELSDQLTGGVRRLALRN